MSSKKLKVSDSEINDGIFTQFLHMVVEYAHYTKVD